MNTALLVLRIIPGLLLLGHGLQKLVFNPTERIKGKTIIRVRP
jgi:uncharacterized membrane protein YphA (DoxX/SURF4 family)